MPRNEKNIFMFNLHRENHQENIVFSCKNKTKSNIQLPTLGYVYTLKTIWLILTFSQQEYWVLIFLRASKQLQRCETDHQPRLDA